MCRSNGAAGKSAASSEEMRQTWWEALQGAAGKGLRKSNWC